MTVVGGVSVLLISSLALGSSLVFVFFPFTFDDVLDDFLRVVIVVGEYRFEMV